ncbi:carbohydrate-binding protein [Glycomyces xiaoerkulensis]|uniref:carbohydrate-binding protein n=1 Tax=Glycomyces xiaoerkulensis TaxID=2038139 RepID=UPI0013000D25|nr:carbohydrate-binding protein [Glycomyces xiaoerkulensis]
MRHRSGIAVGTALLTGVGALILSAQIPSVAEEPDTSQSDAALIEAMERDLGLTTEEVHDRLAAEDLALEIEAEAAESLGASYAGTWVTDDGVVVATAGPTTLATSEVDTVAVEHSAAELDAYAADFAAAANSLNANDEIHSWYVDLPRNAVAIAAADRASADRVAAAAGLEPDSYRVSVEPEAPAPLQQDIRGGDAYNIAGASRCSVGFAATHPTYGEGFLTAGHCDIGDGSITGGTGVGGQFRASRFPGEDWAWVQAGSGWRTAPVVNRYGGADVEVDDGDEAAIGASVCRSGSTTGWHCGVIEAKGVSVNYPEGSVTGMTRTTVCAEPGDSGGSYISGNSAQGITSGGSGTCPSGWTVFEPLNRALQRTGATLTTTGGQPPTGFDLSLSPTSRTIEAGESTSVTVNTETTSGSPQSVSLSASGAPSGVTVSLSPTQVTTGESATLTVDTAASATAGTHAITVTAQGGDTRTATLTLTIGDDGGGGETTWEPGTAYSVGDRVVYGGVGYVCRIAHTSQSDWTPDATPALWSRL